MRQGKIAVGTVATVATAAPTAAAVVPLPARPLRHSFAPVHASRHLFCCCTAAAGTGGYPNPLGVHALVFAGDLSEASVRTAAAGAAAAGYDILELPAFDAASIDAPMVRAVFAEHGLQPACSLGLSLGADVSSADPAVVARGAAELAAALDFAAAIGARHLCGILYSVRRGGRGGLGAAARGARFDAGRGGLLVRPAVLPSTCLSHWPSREQALAKYPGPPTAAGRAHAVAEIRALAARAADRGVCVCLEVVNRCAARIAPGCRCWCHWVPAPLWRAGQATSGKMPRRQAAVGGRNALPACPPARPPACLLAQPLGQLRGQRSELCRLPPGTRPEITESPLLPRHALPCPAPPRSYETNLLNTAAQALEFLADVGHANAYVHLDTYHMNVRAGPGWAGLLQGAVDRTARAFLGGSWTPTT